MHFKKPDFFHLKIIFYCRKLLAENLPIKVKACQPQMIAEEYSIANVIVVLDAFDTENSEYMSLFENIV